MKDEEKSGKFSEVMGAVLDAFDYDVMVMVAGNSKTQEFGCTLWGDERYVTKALINAMEGNAELRKIIEVAIFGLQKAEEILGKEDDHGNHL